MLGAGEQPHSSPQQDEAASHPDLQNSQGCPRASLGWAFGTQGLGHHTQETQSLALVLKLQLGPNWKSQFLQN